ncbi:MAG: enoyl-CoA hydratase/isomerase family protein [Acidimicrobiales bacterium]
MSPEFITLQRRPDGVALLRLDRPKMNALSVDLLVQLAEAASDLEANPPGAVVVWGGPRLFAAGADIAEFGDSERAGEIGGLFHRALNTLAQVPRAVIAAITGYALGGGCELALACDFRVMAASARMGQPEIQLGIIPGGGGTQRLARLVGPARAKALILTGRQVGATEAESIGLVDRVITGPSREAEAEAVLEAALEWAGELARGPVLAHALAKRAIDAGLDGDLRAGLALELECFKQVFATVDAQAGVASFLAQGPGKATFVGK